MQSGYKRKARVVFVASGSLRRAQAAADAALASGWLEARACCLPPMMGAQGAAAQEPGWDWPDLVVALDEPARRQVPALPPHVQVRCYEFAEPAREADWPALQNALWERVWGMAAGLAMMQRAARE